MGRWRFGEEVALADCAVDLEGRDLDDLFETAALALAHLMVDPTTVAVTLDRVIALEAAKVREQRLVRPSRASPCIVILGQAPLEDRTVTWRDRDTLEQTRVPIDRVVEELASRLRG